jgi:hypothetical protein
MITEEDFAEAASTADPALAFVRLETRFRGVLKKSIDGGSDNNYAYGMAVAEYMNHTIAVAQFFNFDFLDSFDPEPNDATIADMYGRFTMRVDAFKVRVQLAQIRTPMEYSVGLSTTDKVKLRFFVEQMKTVIDDAKLPEEKRDELMNILNDFLAAADRNRAPWNIFADFVIKLASVGGEAAKKLEPVRQWIDSIANLLGHNKEIENSQPKLPKPERKKIEDSRPKSEPQAKPSDVDDEIPF